MFMEERHGKERIVQDLCSRCIRSVIPLICIAVHAECMMIFAYS